MPADESILFKTMAEWRRWLRAHHAAPEGLWVRFAKKTSAVESVSYEEALEEALCWGWIDGQKKSYDRDTWLQRFTPRRKGSIWSRLNCERIDRLTASNRMQPAGLKEVERAKADGRWARAYAPASTAEIPVDLAAAFRENPAAGRFFHTLTGVNRYAVLHRLQTAKRPETRQARLEKFVAMLAGRRTIYPAKSSIERANGPDKNTA